MASPESHLKLDFLTVDVFTSDRFKGNPLAVVLIPDAQRPLILQETKQSIAREFNLSETVFLHIPLDPTSTTREIDIFTTEAELPFAGHPTIGSAYLVLNHLGLKHVTHLITKAGPIAINPEGFEGVVRAQIPHAVKIHQQTVGGALEKYANDAGIKAVINEGLSPDAEIRAAELAAPVVSIVKGMTFVLVKLPSLEHLSKITSANRLYFEKLPSGVLQDQGEWDGGFVARYYYVLTEDAVADGEGKQKWKLQTRMTELGFEDPATGSAACTLASYLSLAEKAEKGARFEITQGVEMGRRSEIVVEATVGNAEVKEIFLGGTAVVVMNGSIRV
ncbi:phenazine biosynthesis PhzC/PhzF protein [Cladorrhinum sp. PSN332]|nr:phenazine biosynthesis PhzC/PhzF protein [Cladorrhinum sp. PSN332]